MFEILKSFSRKNGVATVGQRGATPDGLNRSSLPVGFTSETAAQAAILDGTARDGLWTGRLKFEREPKLRVLPKGLTAAHISISECPNFQGLPENLWAGIITIRKCPAFRDVPASAAFQQLEVSDQAGDLTIGDGASLGSVRLVAFLGSLKFGERLLLKDLVWRESPLETFPVGIRVHGTLDLANSRCLSRLPPRMNLEALILRQCPNLASLPDNLEARIVDVSGCTALGWQESSLVEITNLNLEGCPQITSLPWWLIVKGSIDVANTGMVQLPDYQRDCRLLWRGVEVDQRIAFRPDQIGAQDIFGQRNSEVRRVMLERMGWERFLREAKPRIRDRDTDPGGDRRLFHVSLPDREELLVLNINCPSTGRNYFIRVPPYVASCHQAAAWIAGFDDPKEYEPVVET